MIGDNRPAGRRRARREVWPLPIPNANESGSQGSFEGPFHPLSIMARAGGPLRLLPRSFHGEIFPRYRRQIIKTGLSSPLRSPRRPHHRGKTRVNVFTALEPRRCDRDRDSRQESFPYCFLPFKRLDIFLP